MSAARTLPARGVVRLGERAADQAESNNPDFHAVTTFRIRRPSSPARHIAPGGADCAPSQRAWMGSLRTSMMRCRPRRPPLRPAPSAERGRLMPVSMALVDNDRQMRQLMQHKHSREVERVARVIMKRADAAFAEDDLLVAAGHDVFRAHQQLFERVGQAALEQDGLVRLAKLTQQVKFCIFRAPTCKTSTSSNSGRSVMLSDLGDDGQAVSCRGDLPAQGPSALSPAKS